jgi:signal transduction histidine kinase
VPINSPQHAIAPQIPTLEATPVPPRDDTDFLVYLSHELRTALNAMLGHAQLLEQADLDDDAARSVEKILSAGWHVTGLLDEVHDVVAAESGRAGAIDVERVDLSPLLAELTYLVQPLARDRDIEVELATTPPGAVARADRRRLTQVVLNLLSNAIKHNHVGGSVGVRSSLADGVVRIAIADTGPGLTRERLSDLFAPFERLGADSGDVGGSGIGLVLSRRLVEMMDGSLEAESEPGEGTVFTVELPLARSREVDAAHVCGGV